MPNTDVALEVFYDGAWHDLVTSDQVLAEQAITITRGDGAESAAPRPASLTARLNSADDSLRITNPESPLYGRAGRNAPVRVSVDGTVRAATEATSWASGQTREFRVQPRRGKAWVDLESGGLLQRVNNWTEPLRSTFFEYNNALTTTVGYWPGEEGRDARALTAITPGSASRTLRGYSFDGQSYPPGSGPVLDLSTSVNAFASGTFAPHTSGGNAGWQASWAQLHNKIDGAGNYSTILTIRTADGGYFIVNRGDTNKIQVQVYTATLFADPALLNTSAVLPTNSSDVWAAYVLHASRSGSTVTVKVFRALAGETGFTEILSGTYSGALDRMGSWQTSTGLDDNPISFGHLIGVVGQTDDLTTGDRVTAFNGHAGENAGQRFARLCGLKGLPYFLRGDSALSAVMGPQTVQTLAEQFRELRDTEDGLIFDEKGGLFLIFTLRNARYNVPAARIDVSELPAAPDEVSDDLGLHNLVTVTNSPGGEATAVDSTGPLGTAAPPDGVGEYRFDVDVNLDDVTELPQHANWWLKRGTVDLPRYPKVTVNLSVLDPAKRAEIEDVDIGEVLEITGYRENTIRLLVIGYVETIPWGGSRRITFTCAPDQQFDVGTYGASTAQRRYDMRTATVKTAAGRADTTLTLKCTDDEAWSNASTYDVMIAGERVTFVAGQVGARTGTLGDYQQIATNVVRSVNGVRKALPAGSAVHVAEQGRWAL